MRMFKKVLAGFVAAAMVATMAGCGSSNSSTKDSGSDKAAAEATTEAAAPAKVLNTNAANKLISHHLLLILTSVLFRQHVKKKARS